MSLKVTVTIDGRAEPVEADIINPDRVRWDMTAAKHKWPSFADAPFLGTTFLAWAALRRTGQYTDTFEAFRDRDALDVVSHDPDADDEDDDAIEGVGNPTR